MVELRPRQIAWQIIACEPDPHRRTEQALAYPGTVRDHVRIWNQSEDMKINALVALMRRLASCSRSHPNEEKRAEAAAELRAARYQCRGWILERIDATARAEREAG